MPEMQADWMEHKYYSCAPIPFGSPDNRGFWSAFRWNYSKLGHPIAQGLGAYGNIHVDQNDEPTLYTNLVSYSNPRDDDTMGHMYLPALGLQIPQETNGAIMFSARHHHVGMAAGRIDPALPQDSPFRQPTVDRSLVPQLPPFDADNGGGIAHHWRLNCVMIQNHSTFKPELRWMSEAFFTPVFLVNLQSEGQHMEWMMRFYIVHEPEIQWRFSLRPEIDFNSLRGQERLVRVLTLIRKGETAAGIAEKVAASGYQRNGTPQQYAYLFPYYDGNGILTNPDPEEARKTLEALSNLRPEYDTRKADVESLLTGVQFPKTGGRKAEYLRRPLGVRQPQGLFIAGDTVPTHENLDIDYFDPSNDFVPGNQNLESEGDQDEGGDFSTDENFHSYATTGSVPRNLSPSSAVGDMHGPEGSRRKENPAPGDIFETKENLNLDDLFADPTASELESISNPQSNLKNLYTDEGKGSGSSEMESSGHILSINQTLDPDPFYTAADFEGQDGDWFRDQAELIGPKREGETKVEDYSSIGNPGSTDQNLDPSLNFDDLINSEEQDPDSGEVQAQLDSTNGIGDRVEKSEDTISRPENLDRAAPIHSTDYAPGSPDMQADLEESYERGLERFLAPAFDNLNDPALPNIDQQPNAKKRNRENLDEGQNDDGLEDSGFYGSEDISGHNTEPLFGDSDEPDDYDDAAYKEAIESYERGVRESSEPHGEPSLDRESKRPRYD